jgi:hypothetical protein
MALPDWNWTLFARAAIVGAVGAATLFVVLVLGGRTPFRASEIAFSLAALPFAIGLIGWSTAILSGNAIEGFTRTFDISDEWTAESGRRTMALLVVAGLTGMVSVSLVAAVYGA